MSKQAPHYCQSNDLLFHFTVVFLVIRLKVESAFPL